MTDWPTETLQSLCLSITDGKHGDCQDEAGSGYFFISAKDVHDGKIHYNGAREITRLDFEETHRRTRLMPDDILITNSGSIGRLALVPDTSLAHKTTFQKSVAIVKLKKNLAVPKFLYYTFQNNRQALEDLSGGTAQKNLLLGDLRKFVVRLPPPHIQRKIAAVLSAYDDLIENNTRRIALLEQMAEEIYREWFVRLRFPGHERVPMHQGVPEGWGLISVNDAFEIMGGGTPSKDEGRYWNGGEINWYTPSDITAAEGIFLSSSGMQCTEEGLSNSSARLFPPYSLMMTSRATIGALGINTTAACTNQGFIACIPNESFPFTYLYFWLKLNKENFELLSTGSTFLELIKSNFRKIKILEPSPDVAMSYHKINEPVFKLIETLLQDNQNLKMCRDMLLSRLLSGKLDVENLDIRFPAGMSEPADDLSLAAVGGNHE